jgi:hypothetical protein
VGVDVLLAWLHHFTKGEVWVHRTSLTLSLFIKCLYQARKVSGYVFVCRGIDFASLDDFCFIGLWNFSNSVMCFVLLDFRTFLTLWWFLFYWTLELFWQCHVFCFIGLWNFSDSVMCFVLLDFGTFLTVSCVLFYWTLELFWQCHVFCFIGLWNFSDSVMCFVLLDFGTFLTVSCVFHFITAMKNRHFVFYSF